MTVVRINIRKILEPGTYAYGQSSHGPFSSDYLIQTEAGFPDPQLETYAQNIACAESRLFPSCVIFERAQIKLSTPDASADELRRQFLNVDLSTYQTKFRGQWIMGEDDTLAFPPVTAVYGRDGAMGAARSNSTAIRCHDIRVESLHPDSHTTGTIRQKE